MHNSNNLRKRYIHVYMYVHMQFILTRVTGIGRTTVTRKMIDILTYSEKNDRKNDWSNDDKNDLSNNKE